nr:unnamed protein product [Digitaria exilis]
MAGVVAATGGRRQREEEAMLVSSGKGKRPLTGEWLRREERSRRHPGSHAAHTGAHGEERRWEKTLSS